MKGERIMIFGDSYSTFKGHIPEGYAPFYPYANIPSVDDVEKTWWGRYLRETGSTLVLNNSWSGSTVCNTGYSGDASKTTSFIFRLSQLIENGFFASNPIDRVFVFGGTNDSWTNNACGELKFSDWTEEDLRLILPGICYFIHTLLTVVAKEKIHYIVNTELREEVTEGILQICNHFGVSCTRLSDVDKIEGHPTAEGMNQIKNQVINSLK